MSATCQWGYMDTELIRNHILKAFFTPSPSIGLKVETAIDLRKSSPFSGRPYRYESVGKKKVRIDVDPIHVNECRSYKASKIPLLESAFSDIAWSRAIRKSPKIYRYWIDYCYNDDINEDSQNFICNSIWAIFTEDNSRNITHKSTRVRLKSLVWLCIQDAKEIISTGNKLFSDSDLSRAMNIHQSHWGRTFRPYWKKMTELCLILDEDALEYVGKILK